MELSQNSILIILFFLKKKGMNDRVPAKGNCVDSGSSLVKKTSSCLLFRNVKDRLWHPEYYYIMSFTFPSFVFLLEDP